MADSYILVIAADGLKKFVPALSAAAAIRTHHNDAKIILLTSKTTRSFAETSPYFDEVWTTDLQGPRDLAHLWALRKRLHERNFACVYDLDGTPLSKRIFWLMYGLKGLPLRRKTLPWSGIIKNTALSHQNAQWNAMHTTDRWATQLAAAGISGLHKPDLSWVARNVQSFEVPFRMHKPFVLISLDPGPSSAWPVDLFKNLAGALSDERQTPVFVGFNTDPRDAVDLSYLCEGAINLVNGISPEDLVFLSWAATAAIGADNGVMHLTAAAACHSVVIYDRTSDPALSGQRGDSVVILRRPHLSDISVDEIMSAIRKSPKMGGI